MTNLFNIDINSQIEIVDVKPDSYPSLRVGASYLFKRGLFTTRVSLWGDVSKSVSHEGGDVVGGLTFLNIGEMDWDTSKPMIADVTIDNLSLLKTKLKEMGLEKMSDKLGFTFNEIKDIHHDIIRNLPIVQSTFGNLPIYEELPKKDEDEDDN